MAPPRGTQRLWFLPCVCPSPKTAVRHRDPERTRAAPSAGISKKIPYQRSCLNPLISNESAGRGSVWWHLLGGKRTMARHVTSGSSSIDYLDPNLPSTGPRPLLYGACRQSAHNNVIAGSPVLHSCEALGSQVGKHTSASGRRLTVRPRSFCWAGARSVAISTSPKRGSGLKRGDRSGPDDWADYCPANPSSVPLQFSSLLTFSTCTFCFLLSFSSPVLSVSPSPLPQLQFRQRDHRRDHRRDRHRTLLCTNARTSGR